MDNILLCPFITPKKMTYIVHRAAITKTLHFVKGVSILFKKMTKTEIEITTIKSILLMNCQVDIVLMMGYVGDAVFSILALHKGQCVPFVSTSISHLLHLDILLTPYCSRFLPYRPHHPSKISPCCVLFHWS